jgi:uncharacterized protein YraI
VAFTSEGDFLMPRLSRYLIVLLLCITTLAFTSISESKAQGGLTVTTKGRVVLRSGAGLHYPSLGRVPNNTVLPAVGRNDKTTWIQVKFNETFGWLSANGLTPSGDLNALPISAITMPGSVREPTIPVYDDFSGPSINLDKWTLGGSDFVQNIDNRALALNISWYFVAFVKTDRPMREISALITMEQPNKGNSGINLSIVGLTTYTIAINHCKAIGINEIAPGNNWINGKGHNLRDTDCPSTHLLGISIEGNRANIYLDGKRIDSRPWTGPIKQAWFGGWGNADFQTDSAKPPNMNDPNFKPTIGRVHRVWVDFVP